MASKANNASNEPYDYEREALNMNDFYEETSQN
jgi:hypothetical protein